MSPILLRRQSSVVPPPKLEPSLPSKKRSSLKKASPLEKRQKSFLVHVQGKSTSRVALATPDSKKEAASGSQKGILFSGSGSARTGRTAVKRGTSVRGFNARISKKESFSVTRWFLGIVQCTALVLHLVDRK